MSPDASARTTRRFRRSAGIRASRRSFFTFFRPYGICTRSPGSQGRMTSGNRASPGVKWETWGKPRRGVGPHATRAAPPSQASAPSPRVAMPRSSSSPAAATICTRGGAGLDVGASPGGRGASSARRMRRTPRCRSMVRPPVMARRRPLWASRANRISAAVAVRPGSPPRRAAARRSTSARTGSERVDRASRSRDSPGVRGDSAPSPADSASMRASSNSCRAVTWSRVVSARAASARAAPGTASSRAGRTWWRRRLRVQRGSRLVESSRKGMPCSRA